MLATTHATPAGQVGTAPRVRAGYLKHTLVSLGRLAPGEPAALRLRLGPAMAEVERATSIDWLPLETALSLVDDIDLSLGREQLRTINREAVLDSLRGPLLGHLFGAIVHVFGLAPERILASAPRAFAAIWSGAGELSVESAAPGQVILRHQHIPDAWRTPALLEAAAASFEAVPVACGVPSHGVAEPDGRHGARYVIRW